MGENSGIQWCHHTFNGWLGCAKVAGSPECDNCYAESGSKRLAAQHGLKLWEGDRYFTVDNYWKQPAAWNRKAEKAGERHRVFCASYSDVFEDRPDLVATRERLLRVIVETPSLDWLLLTKRPENMVRLAEPVFGRERWPANVWAGTTVGVSSSLSRLRDLVHVPARTRFVSYEPALELVDFRPWLRDCPDVGECSTHVNCPEPIDWLIIGGESGPRARPFALEWAVDVVEQCRGTHCAPFVKQMGSRPTRDGAPWKLNDSHGGDMGEWPEAIRIREFPKGAT